MTIDQIAQIVHQANKTYCETIGDNSQLNWDEAPDWQKESAINGVNFHLQNPDANASASHDSWLREKIENGWIYEEIKNPDKKEHPCIVPFDSLSVEQQIKDYLFKAIVHGLALFVE